MTKIEAIIKLFKFFTPSKTTMDCMLYFYTAFGTGIEAYLATEESYKYMNPAIRFYLIMFIGSSVGGLNAVKAFRSMTYSRSQGMISPTDVVNNPSTGGTQFITKITPTV